MIQQKRSRKVMVLSAMVLVGMSYLLLLYTQHPLTSTYRLDGIISVVLGLYICSHPVANVLDVLLFQRHLPPRKSLIGTEILWWGLNGVVLATGFWVIFVGMLRFSLPTV